MPTILIVVLAIYGVFFTLLPLSFWLYSLRVVYLKGYVRLQFTDPATKVVTSVLVRLKPDQTTYTTTHGTYDLDNDAVRYLGKFRLPFYEFIQERAESIIIGAGKDELQKVVDSAVKAEQENDPNAPVERRAVKPVIIDEDHITAFSPRVAAIGFKNVAKNVAMQQLIASFRKQIMSPTSLVLLSTIVIVVAIVILGAYLGNNQNQIMQAMGIK